MQTQALARTCDVARQAEHRQAPALPPFAGQIVPAANLTRECPSSLPALCAEYVAAHDRAELERDRLKAAEVKAFALYPPRPSSTEAQRLHDEQCRALDRAFSVDRHEAACERAWSQLDGLAQAIVATRPCSVAEAAMKLGVVLKYFGNGRGEIDEPGRMFDFLAELEALATEPSIACDAVRRGK